MNMDMGMDMSSSSTNSSSDDDSTYTGMASLFFQSTSTPLFTSAFTPRNSAQYAGTLFFLVVLGILMRVLLSLRPVFEATVWRRRGQPRVHIGEGRLLDADRDLEVERVMKEELGSHGDGRRYKSSSSGIWGAPSSVWAEVRERWRGTTVLKSLGRAGFEVLLAGIGYLLMLAVMTMNVGYFLAVLGGVFVGTFMLGNLAGMAGNGDDGQTQHC